jgi:hypothetical protein
MDLSDIGTAASTIATIVAAVFTVASFFKKQPVPPMRSGVAQPIANSGKRYVFVVAALAVASWCAVVFDYYERHSNRDFSYSAVVNSWGINGSPPSYYLVANANALSDYKSKFKLMLILRVPYGDVDRMTDSRIEKSALYTIVAPAVTLLHVVPSGMRLEFELANSPGT